MSRTSKRTRSARFDLHGISLRLPEGLVAPEIAEKLKDGSYEADEVWAADRCVKEDFRVLDLGAGLGVTSALAAQRTAPENVLAVEANPELIPVLRQTLAENNAQGVSVIHAAVTGPMPEETRLPFHIADKITASSLDGVSERIVEVPAVSMYDLIRSHRPHVVLMDVEGAETALFNRPWKCPLRFCVVELHPQKYGAKAVKRIVDHMSEMGLTYDPATSRGRVLGFRKVWDQS